MHVSRGNDWHLIVVVGAADAPHAQMYIVQERGERQRPHRFSTWCDETEIRLKSDLVSSFDVH